MNMYIVIYFFFLVVSAILIICYLEGVFVKSDWVTVWTTKYSSGYFQSVYEIQYSAKKGEYRMITSGDMPKIRDEYAQMVRKFNELTNKNI